MDVLTRDENAGRERTLLAAVLLSMWAPLATGIAVFLSSSTTQLADFIRRSVELVALLVSWLVFRVIRKQDLDVRKIAGLEKFASLSVAVTLGCSGLIMLGLALARINSFVPGGNVYPGLTVAGLGLLVNLWFWRRYTKLSRGGANAIIAAQGRLYRAKCLVDLCVIGALAAVAVDPTHVATRYIDILGTGAVSVYLLFSAVGTARQAMTQSRQLEREMGRGQDEPAPTEERCKGIRPKGVGASSPAKKM